MMLLNEDPCKECEVKDKPLSYGDYKTTTCYECKIFVAYQAQRELLGKVVEDLRERAEQFRRPNQDRYIDHIVKAQINDIASTYEKELQG